ncbi:hypothetical protein INT45_004618 [Circinella minor]|uniref:Heterokaryon incompatibility domain-containing protein n=1 Tax=Circinella minor TaxID=1195481 RepID=A0A8H7S1K1_9FUNG|nr:hypothetical protein INT45_004618 [Circinella minor]
MHITYTKKQYSDYKKGREVKWVGLDKNGKIRKYSHPEGIHKYSQPPKKIPPILPKPNYMPSYLVRTSDMKVIKGSEVHEGYCALSYSWNQSGEIIRNETTGNMERADKGKHKIIYPARTVRKKPRGRKRIPRKVKFVKFERLIQEICKDFNIKYIWYDQMCINQNNETEKYSEIHQMHKIYSNGYCTIALVPDLTVNVTKQFRHSSFGFTRMDRDSLLKAQWMKRMWTLEEAILSSKMVLIGERVHCWYHQVSSFLFPIFRKDFFGSNISTLLHYAHARTSTKEHDHIFALANVFPEVIKEIKIDYDQDIQELMIQFYGLLAKKDLNILYFGPYHDYKTMCKTSINYGTEGDSKSEAEYSIPIQKFNLPSWTGVYGEHDYRAKYKTPFKNYIVNGNVLQVTCAAMTNDQYHTEILDLGAIKGMIPPLPRQNRKCFRRLVISLQSERSTNKQLIHVHDIKRTGLDSTDYERIATKLRNLSHFMSIKNSQLLWTTTLWHITVIEVSFHGLTEPLEDSTQYVLLSGVPFEGKNRMKLVCYPVIKKERDYYKAIGMCWIRDKNARLFDDIPLEEQTFKIY